MSDAQGNDTRDGDVVANGWTRKEAEAMDAHIGAKYAREHPEPSEAATRQAERMADPTDRMHDARREAEADAYGRRTETAQRPATPKEDVEARTGDYQQLLERAQNDVRKAGGDPDASWRAMEAAADKLTGATPWKPATDPSGFQSDWEVANNLARARVSPQAVEQAVREVVREATAPDRVEVARTQDAAQARREDVRRAADDYRARLMAAAPAQPEAPAQVEAQGKRASQRV